jgi:hypothetical protein
MSTSIAQAPGACVSYDPGFLWKRAYQGLRKEDKDILSSYEKQISKHNKILIDKKLRGDDITQLTLKVAGKSLRLRELGQKIISFITYSQGYIQAATSLDPHAALAWTCVSILLPVSELQSGVSYA